METLYVRLAPRLVAIVELALMAATGLLIVISTLRGERSWDVSSPLLKRSIGRWVRRPGLVAFAIGVSVIALRSLLIPILGIPQPRWNDEFSYLLAGDTFSHGRLTNPTSPSWIHFESFHIIERPTYMSMYPPAQGMVLAAGELLGHPWIGQLLVTAATFSILCWMLQGWMPPGWALLGAVLAALRLGILSYWMNSYWCASVAALGGALVLGAWPRLRKLPTARMSLVLGCGLVILANSRPYEGLVFAIPIAVDMLRWLLGARRPAIKPALGRVVVPVLIVLSIGGAATGYYYFRVTGSPFVMTYQVNRNQYAMAPYFIWQTPRPEPVYHHQVMRDYYRWELGEFNRNRTLKGYVERSAEKIGLWWQFYLGPLLTVPLLALPWLLRSQKMRLPLLICGAMMAGFAVQTWTLPHYFSPATGALYVLLVQGLRHLKLWRRSWAKGRAVVRGIFLVASAMIVLRVAAAEMQTQIEPKWPRGNLDRANVISELQRLPGKQLVFVRYGNHHDADWEWVWNQASIDASKVVWARDMGDIENDRLLRSFSNRQPWRIAGDDPHPKVEPYLPLRESSTAAGNE